MDWRGGSGVYISGGVLVLIVIIILMLVLL